MKLRDKFGWPVTTVKGAPFLSFARILIHTDIVQTWRRRHAGKPTAPHGRGEIMQEGRP